MIDFRDPDDLARLGANAFLWLWLALGVLSFGVCYYAILGVL